MKETRFIAQNKEKWLESENLLNEPVKDPEKLSNLFTQVIDDLSFSRTYYQHRSVRVYLNQLAREYFSIIYSHQKEKKNRFRLFWVDELPQLIIFSRKQLLISLVVFLCSVAIGVFSAIKDPQFSGTILGKDYIAMTQENIKSGDPMAVYKKGHQVDMFLGITINNLMVAFRIYVFGIFLSIGTIAILLYNGIMVGCFQYFFIDHGLLQQSALAIWLHGTLEISSIILAGGAGLTLGTGLIFPGTYSRLQAFQISAIRSLKLMLGITPIFVLAAIIESFLTRYTEVPDAIRLLLILASAFLIIGYFVVYPWMKSRKGFEVPLTEVRIAPGGNEAVDYRRIKNDAEILKDSFQFYQKYINKLMPRISLVTIAMTIGVFYFEDDQIFSRAAYEVPWVSFLSNLFFALRTPHLASIAINAIGTSVILTFIFRYIQIDGKNKVKSIFPIRSFIRTSIVTALIFALFYSISGWGYFLLVFSYLFFLMVSFGQQREQYNLVHALRKSWTLMTEHFGKMIGLQLILLLLAFSFLLILTSPLLYLNITVLEWNFAKTDVWAKHIIHFIELFVKIFAFNMVLPILASSAAYLYFSLSEIETAEHLKHSIAAIGQKLSKKTRR